MTDRYCEWCYQSICQCMQLLQTHPHRRASQTNHDQHHALPSPSNGSPQATYLSADARLWPESDHKEEGPVERQPIMARTTIINRTPTAAGGGSLICAGRHRRRVYMQGVGRCTAQCTLRMQAALAGESLVSPPIAGWDHGGTGVQLLRPGPVGLDAADDFKQSSKNSLVDG